MASSDPCVPIAIIGMGCRLPDKTTQPSELWDFLKAGRDAYTDFPKSRMNVDGFYHEKKNRPGSFYTRGGCFLGLDPYEFDHTFYGINPQEATTMDPAQRKLLETVFEAFEAAGAPLEKIAGSNTGCFVGNFNRDHSMTQYRDVEFPQPYVVTGGGDAILSNRVNYLFNLKGPSLTVDTACSSSLYALHLACSAIQSGDCDGAIVAGSNLVLTPEAQLFSSALGAVSPTSRCHTFDAAADGYARADGIGAIYIKRLSNAIQEKDPIRAIIRGTAVNSNGKTGGITHPSSEGQEAAIRHAYTRAGGLPYDMTGYVECHGTGTPVGDPLEIAAIGRVFANDRSPHNPLLVGSIKSNIGHTESASGIAGIIKTVLALENGIIPPTVGLQTLNPQVDLKSGRLKIPTENTPWPSMPIRRASVNSFGYGGANAHVILDAASFFLPNYNSTRAADGRIQKEMNGYPLNSVSGFHGNMHNKHNAHLNGSYANGVKQITSSRTQFLLTFSAHNESTLEKNIATINNVKSRYRIIDLAYTLAVCRSAFSDRWFSVESGENAGESKRLECLSTYKKQRSRMLKIAFVFPGQGTQWSKMGLDLMQDFPSYAFTIRRLDDILASLTNPPKWTLQEIIQSASQERMNEAEISQPTTTAVQIALVDLLMAWDIKPSVTIGHSSGEIAAAYASGHISIKDAMIAAFIRGQVASQNRGDGLMLAVGASEKEVRIAIKERVDSVTIACHNSPESFTLSGIAEEVLAMKKVFESKKLFTRSLATGGNAYHSVQMLELGPTYEALMNKNRSSIRSIDDNLPRVDNFSSVTGKRQTLDVIGSQYWRRNLESPVLFQQAIEELVETQQVDLFLEIGPHAALRSSIQQIAASKPHQKYPQYCSTLVRGQDSTANMLYAAGTLWAQGHQVNLERVNALDTVDEHGDVSLETGNVIADLPRYQWQYGKLLSRENRWAREWRMRKHPRHDILGSRLPGGNKNVPTWRNVLRYKDLDWLGHHRLGSEIIFPAAGYMCMAVEAITQTWELNGHEEQVPQVIELQNVYLITALAVPEDEHGIETLFTLYPVRFGSSGDDQKYCYRFQVVSVINSGDEDAFVEHANGQIRLAEEFDGRAEPPAVPASSAATTNIPEVEWYDTFDRMGLSYGPLFRTLSHIEGGNNSNVAKARVNLCLESLADGGESRYMYHPAVLDAFLQLSIIAGHSNMPHRLQRRFLPVSFDRITIRPSLPPDREMPAQVSATGALNGTRALNADLSMMGASNNTLIKIAKATLLASDPVSSTSLHEKADPFSKKQPYQRMVWSPDPEFFTTAVAKKLYPPRNLGDTALVPKLNNLALHQIIQFHITHSHNIETGSIQTHLRRLLDWISLKVNQAHQNAFPHCKDILHYSTAKRAEEIHRLSTSLNVYSVESRTICRIYGNLSSIFKSEKTGIEVALQDNLLSEMYENGQIIKEGNRRLACVVEILANKASSPRVLEIGAGTGSATREILPALKGDCLYRKYKEYVFTDITPSFLRSAEERLSNYRGVTYDTFDMQKPGSDQRLEPGFDLIIASNVVHASSDILEAMRNLRNMLKVGGKIVLLEITQPLLFAGLLLGTFSDFWNGSSDAHVPRHDGPFMSKSEWHSVLSQSGFSGLDIDLDDYAEQPSSSVLVGTAVDLTVPSIPLSLPQTEGVTVVYRNNPTMLVSALSQYLGSQNLAFDLLSLSDYHTPKYSRQLCLTETETPLFNDISPSEWTSLQNLLQTATHLLWVTNGGLLSGREPLFSMIGGIVRGLKTEKSSLRISTLDLDRNCDQSLLQDCKVILDIFEGLSQDSSDAYTLEYRQKEGVLYRSILQADESMNNEWDSRVRNNITDRAWSQLEAIPLQLEIDQSGLWSAAFFKEDRSFSQPLPEGFVEIRMAAAGLNDDGIALRKNSLRSNILSNGCAGTVIKVDNRVTRLVPGDRIYCLYPTNLGNFARVDSSLCQKLKTGQSFEDMATLPNAFCTAVHGLVNLGHLTQAETVLIDIEATGAMLAAIQISHLRGAKIYVRVETSTQKEELLKAELNLDPSCVLYPREESVAKALYVATGGRGVDVILSSSEGESMHDCWYCLASFGRFVHVGLIEAMGTEELDMNLFQRNATFTCFDIQVIIREKPELGASLMRTIDELHRNGSIKSIPFREIQVSNIKSVLLSPEADINPSMRIVSYSNNNSVVQFQDSPSKVTFDPDATYLVAGGLGGLGRNFTRWMIDRGAKSFTYLSRSGLDKQDTRDFIAELQDLDIDAQFVKGDVSSFDDVKRAVASTERPIKGVVQAALTLQDKTFERMTLEMFETTIKPRVTGTINLHLALEHQPLDFFVMWSSWTAIFGNATQASYLASCAFMDAFARHRNSLGLPATSLSMSRIGNVGVVGRNNINANILARSGFYGNNEDDFLEYCESAIDPQLAKSSWIHDPLASAHLLAGIEPAGLQKLDKTYPIREMGWFHDRRFSNLILATEILSSRETGPIRELEEDVDEGEVLDRIHKRVAQLLYISKDDIDVTRALSDYGIDSMIAGELRNWIFTVFAKEVSLFSMLSQAVTIESLACEVSGVDQDGK